MNNERVVCEISTPSALKVESVSCLIPEAHYFDGWMLAATWLTALATVGLVLGAVIAWRTAKETLKQMRHDSISRARPYLYATLAPSLNGGSKYDLLIENTGASTARKVRATCLEFPSAPDDIAEKIKRFLNAEHTMPPGVRLRNYWRLCLETGHTWSDGTTEPAGMPERTSLILDYEDDEGRKYQDTYHLDVVSLMFAPMPTKGSEVKASLSPEQKDTHKMLGIIAAALGELRR